MTSLTFLLSLAPSDLMLGEMWRMRNESDFYMSVAPSNLMLEEMSRMRDESKKVT